MRPAGDFFFIQLSNTRVIQHFLGGFTAGIMFTALKKEGYNDKINPVKSKINVKSTISED